MSLLVCLSVILHGEQQQAFKTAAFLRQKNSMSATFQRKKLRHHCCFEIKCDTPLTLWHTKQVWAKITLAQKVLIGTIKSSGQEVFC